MFYIIEDNDGNDRYNNKNSTESYYLDDELNSFTKKLVDKVMNEFAEEFPTENSDEFAKEMCKYFKSLL
tara:strand:- start:2307 stop:2513 length:207 start_codon:yes stop_codon:yes gene_type:complete